MLQLPDVGQLPSVPPGTRFVGRRGMLRELLDFAAALISADEHYQLRWYGGFGGLGKTEFIRAFCREVSAQNARLQVGLIDFNPEWRQLHEGVMLFQQLDLLDVIARRVAQLYGAGALLRYWTSRAIADSVAAKRAALMVDFKMTAQRLIEQPSEPSDVRSTPGAFGRGRAGRSVHFLRELIRTADPRAATTHVRPTLIRILGSPGELDRLFQAWASNFHPDSASAQVLECYTRAAEALTDDMVGATREKPLLLVIDTHERLSQELDQLLFQTLHPLLNGQSAFGLVIASRKGPDRGRWLLVAERIRSIKQFDEKTNLTIEEISEAVSSVVGSKGDVDGLSKAVARVTRGVPLLVGILLDKLEKDPAVFSDWDLRAVPETASAPEEIYRELLEEFFLRVLLHVKDDGFFQPDSDFTLVLALAVLGPRRLSILQHVWPDIRERLSSLRQAHSFVRGDGLHEEVRRWLRDYFRRAPHAWIAPLLTKLQRAHELERGDEAFDEAYLLESANLASWQSSSGAVVRIAPFMTIAMARGQGLDGFSKLLKEIPAEDASSNLLKGKLLHWGEQLPWVDPEFQDVEWLPEQMTRRGWRAEVQDHVRLLVGLSKRGGAPAGIFAVLLKATENLGENTPRAGRVVDRLAELAFDTADPEHVKAVVRTASRLRQSAVPRWKDLAYEEHDRIVRDKPADDSVRKLQLRLRQQIDAIRQIGSADDGLTSSVQSEGPLVLVLSHMLSRHDKQEVEARTLLLGVTAETTIDSSSLLQAELLAELIAEQRWDDCNKLIDAVDLSDAREFIGAGGWLSQLDPAVPEAADLLDRILALLQLEQRHATSHLRMQAAVSICIASQRLADHGIRRQKNAATAEQLLSDIRDSRHECSASDLNEAAWMMYLANFHLDIAAGLAELALSKEAPAAQIHPLQTLAAIRVRMGAWDPTRQHVLRWSAEVDDVELKKSWPSFRTMFDDLHAQGRSDELAALLGQASRPEIWQPVIDSFKATGAWPRALN